MVSCYQRKSFSEMIKEDSTRIDELKSVAESLNLCEDIVSYQRKSFSEMIQEDTTRIQELKFLADSLNLFAGFILKVRPVDPPDEDVVSETELNVSSSNLNEIKFSNTDRPVVKFSAQKLVKYIGNKPDDTDSVAFYIGTLKGSRITRYKNKFRITTISDSEFENRPTVILRRFNPNNPNLLFLRGRVFDIGKICPPPPGCNM